MNSSPFPQVLLIEMSHWDAGVLYGAGGNTGALGGTLPRFDRLFLPQSASAIVRRRRIKLSAKTAARSPAWDKIRAPLFSAGKGVPSGGWLYHRLVFLSGWFCLWCGGAMNSFTIVVGLTAGGRWYVAVCPHQRPKILGRLAQELVPKSGPRNSAHLYCRGKMGARAYHGGRVR